MLDRPIWSALTTRQSAFALGGPLALRFPADVAPFAALADFSPEAFAALQAIVSPGEAVWMLCDPEGDGAMATAPGFQAEPVATIHQMVASSAKPGFDSAPAAPPLREADAPEMLRLATLTKPGPFGARTHQLGGYIGIREGGELVAMAGERMRLDGYTEISAVCVHPAQRGKGHARALVQQMMGEIAQRGLVPFLHVVRENIGAIALYEQLGFVLRRRFALIRFVRLARL